MNLNARQSHYQRRDNTTAVQSIAITIVIKGKIMPDITIDIAAVANLLTSSAASINQHCE